MSTLSCLCGLKHYGRGQCTVQIGIPAGAILQNRIDSTGVANTIDLNAAFDSAALSALITNADPKKRLIKMPRMRAMDLPTDDTVFDEASDGQPSFVREGVFRVTGEIRDKDAVPPTLKKLKGIRCSDASLYIVTVDNQLVGQLSVDGEYMLPLELNTASVDPKSMFRNDTTTNKIMFNAVFDNIVKPENLYVLDGNDLGIDFLRMQQLTDVNIVMETGAGGVTATTATFSVKSDYAMGLHPNNDIVGYTDNTDWVLTNKTDSSTVTITNVDEDASLDGKYTITFAAQGAGDVMEITPAIGTTFLTGSATFIAE
jgi:hypothetical protein